MENEINTESSYEVIYVCGCLGMVCDCPEANGAPSMLAVALDIAMACDDAAQARYLAIWGVAYTPICNFDGERVGVTAGTVAKTVR